MCKDSIFELKLFFGFFIKEEFYYYNKLECLDMRYNFVEYVFLIGK